MKKLIPFMTIIITIFLTINEVNAYSESGDYYTCTYGKKNSDDEWEPYVTLSFQLKDNKMTENYEPSIVFGLKEKAVLDNGGLGDPITDAEELDSDGKSDFAEYQPTIVQQLPGARIWLGQKESYANDDLTGSWEDIYFISKYFFREDDAKNYYGKSGNERCKKSIRYMPDPENYQTPFHYDFWDSYGYVMRIFFTDESIGDGDTLVEESFKDSVGENGVCNFYGFYLDDVSTSLRGGKACEGNSDFSRQYQKLRDACSGYITSHSYMNSDGVADQCQVDCAKFNDDIAKMCNMNVKQGGYCGSLGNKVVNWIFRIIRIVRYGLPALLIILSILDFIKAIASENDDEMRKVTTRFAKRIIAAALIFIIPFILDFILKMFNIPGLNAENPFCA